ncbi:MAG: deoxyribodipyrimidine photo-lyase [Pseudomonadales bacterium]
MARSLLWFRQDLRLSDNSALEAAIDLGEPVCAVYILDDENLRELGGASRWWLHHSLASLQRDLEKLGGTLHLFQGDSRNIISDLCAAEDLESLHLNRCYEPEAAALEQRVYKSVQSNVDVHRYSGTLLFEPELIVKDDGTPYKVFTPFYKSCLKHPSPSRAVVQISYSNWHNEALAGSCTLAQMNLLPTKPDWSEGLRDSWQPGEQGAHEKLDIFLGSAVAGYKTDRDIPAIDGTSQVSPHLHFGEISPRVIWHQVEQAAQNTPAFQEGATAYLRELVWRDFAYYLLHHWPTLPKAPFRPEYVNFPWQDNAKLREAWSKGQTGYPLVDAGMRQLWHTGWMHNRVRMVVASFLVKHCLQHWQHGEAWFWDTLVDADQANNTASWQWAAGCGADAAPYFRIFNPTLQSQKFDSQGDYIRQYVPELAALPAKYIHEPSKAPAQVLEDAGVELGATYPLPVVEHKMARERALAAHKAMPK